MVTTYLAWFKARVSSEFVLQISQKWPLKFGMSDYSGVARSYHWLVVGPQMPDFAAAVFKIPLITFSVLHRNQHIVHRTVFCTILERFAIADFSKKTPKTRHVGRLTIASQLPLIGGLMSDANFRRLRSQKCTDNCFFSARKWWLRTLLGLQHEFQANSFSIFLRNDPWSSACRTTQV